MWKKVARMAVAISLSVLAFGCTRTQIVEEAVSFNEAVELTANKLVLLNAVRASQRYPMHFSSINQLTASPRIEGSFSLDLPFGGGANDDFTASPSIGHSHTNNIVLKPLDDQEFYRGILEPVNFDLVFLYVYLGWPPELLINMFVESLDLSTAQTRSLIANALLACQSHLKKDPTHDKRWTCINLLEATCKWDSVSGLRDADSEEVCLSPKEVTNAGIDRFDRIAKAIVKRLDLRFGNVRIVNDPTDRASFHAFRIIATSLSILDVDLIRGKEEKFKPVKRTVQKTFELLEDEPPEDGKRVKTKETEKEESEVVGSKRLTLKLAFPKQLEDYEKEEKKDAPSTYYDICTASERARGSETDCLIRFVDEASLQESERKTSVPKAEPKPDAPDREKQDGVKPDEEAKIATRLRSPQSMLYYLGEIIRVQGQDTELRAATKWLFEVTTDASEPAAVTVMFGGKTFSIPAGDHGRSMQVLALIHQVFALKKKGAKFPDVPTVISVGG